MAPPARRCYEGPMVPDPETVSSLLRRAAEEAILPRFQCLAKDEIREKGPGDLVTVADIEAERMLTALLRDLAPGSHVVGEEAAAVDPGILSRLAGQDRVWIIDPVDGTFNFSHGSPDFGVIVAYVEQGRVRGGWIHHPVANVTHWALEGEGTWRGGARLTLPPPPPLPAMVGMVAGMLPGRGRARAIMDASGQVGPTENPRCAARTYARLVEGTYHYAIFTRSLPWDHAAGWLIHREAGGYGAFLDGSPYAPSRHDQPLLFAPGREIWDRLRAILLAPTAD